MRSSILVGVGLLCAVVGGVAVFVSAATAKAPVVRQDAARTLTGRVVTTDGKTVPGASLWTEVVKRKADGTAAGQELKELTTDDRGVYALTGDFPKSPRVLLSADLTAEYRYLRGGKVSEEGGGWRATDVVVMTPRSVTLSGRVTDAKGKPVAGVAVWCREGLPASASKTAADGTITLDALPADGPVTITAVTATADAEVEFQLKAGKPDAGTLTPVNLTLRPLSDAATATHLDNLVHDMQADAPKGGGGYLRDFLRYIARRDPERAIAIGTSEEEKVSAQDRFAVIESFSRRNPDLAAVWSVAQLGKIDDRIWKCCAESELAIALAAKRPAIANRIYDSGLAHLSQGSDVDPFNLARMSAASLVLRRGNETAMLERLKQADLPDDKRAEIIGVVARGSIARAEEMLSWYKTLPPYEAYGAMIQQVVWISPQAARGLLKKMQAAADGSDAGVLATLRAARRVINALGPTDPDGALDAARSVPQPENAPQRYLPVLMAAARYQKGEAAKKLWQEIRDLALGAPKGPGSGGSLAEAAHFARTWGGNEALAAELWTEAKRAFRNYAPGRDLAFLYYAGWFDPPLTRRLADYLFEVFRDTPPGSRSLYQAGMTATTLCYCYPEYAARSAERLQSSGEYANPGWESSELTNTRFLRMRLPELRTFGPLERKDLIFADILADDEDY